jgi:hypothetical protein
MNVKRKTKTNLRSLCKEDAIKHPALSIFIRNRPTRGFYFTLLLQQILS